MVITGGCLNVSMLNICRESSNNTVKSFFLGVLHSLHCSFRESHHINTATNTASVLIIMVIIIAAAHCHFIITAAIIVMKIQNGAKLFRKHDLVNKIIMGKSIAISQYKSIGGRLEK